MSDLDKLEKKYEKGNKAKDIRDLAKTLEGSDKAAFGIYPSAGKRNKRSEPETVKKPISQAIAGFKSQWSGIDDEGKVGMGKGTPGIYYNTVAIPALAGLVDEKYAPDFAVEADKKAGKIKEGVRKNMGIDEPKGALEHFSYAGGEMLGQLPIPGALMAKILGGAKKMGMAGKVAAAPVEYLSPTVDPRAINYGIGTAFGGTLGTAVEAFTEPDHKALGGLVHKYAEGGGKVGTFFSAVDRAINTLKQKKGTGEQILKQLETTPGIKPEELESRAIKQKLQSSPKITQEELQKTIAVNKPPIPKRIKLGAGIDPSWQPKLNKRQEYALGEFNIEIVIDPVTGKQLGFINPETGDILDKRQMLDLTDEEIGLPINPDTGRVDDEEMKQLALNMRRGVQEAQAQFDIALGETKTKYEKYSKSKGRNNYREILLQHNDERAPGAPAMGQRIEELLKINPQTEDEAAAINKELDNLLDRISSAGPQYRNSHWDDPNIFAHYRVSDMVGPNGEKVLYVDEVQSDWHQKARDLRKQEVKKILDKDRADISKKAVEELQATKGTTSINPETEVAYKTIFNRLIKERKAEIEAQVGENVGYLSPEDNNKLTQLISEKDRLRNQGMTTQEIQDYFQPGRVVFNDRYGGVSRVVSFNPAENSEGFKEAFARKLEQAKNAGVDEQIAVNWARKRALEEAKNDWSVTVEELDPKTGELRGQRTHSTSPQENIIEGIVTEISDIQKKLPDAPFKKNWHEIATKDILDLAAKEGYDKVAFSPGIDQVKRYEQTLRQVVDEIRYNPLEDGSLSIKGMKGDRTVFDGRVVGDTFITGQADGKTLSEVFGSSIAKQIEEGTPDLQKSLKRAPEGDPMPTTMDAGDLMWEYGDRLTPHQMSWLRDFQERWALDVDNTPAGQGFENEMVDEYKSWLNSNTLRKISPEEVRLKEIESIRSDERTDGQAEELEMLRNQVAKQQSAVDHPVESFASIKGKDLTIGGEGMKSFYDQRLPSYVKNYAGKEFKAPTGYTEITNPGPSKKATETNIRQMMDDLAESEDDEFMELGMQRAQDLAERRLAERGIQRDTEEWEDAWFDAIDEFQDEGIEQAAREIAVKRIGNPQGEKLKAFTVDVTPQMKEKISTEGQKLYSFAAPPVIAGAAALETGQQMMQNQPVEQPQPQEPPEEPIGFQKGGRVGNMKEAAETMLRVLHGGPSRIRLDREKNLDVTTDQGYAVKRAQDKMTQMGQVGPPMVNKFDVPASRMLRFEETYSPEDVAKMKRFFNKLPEGKEMTGEEIYDTAQGKDFVMEGVAKAGGFAGYERPAAGSGGIGNWFRVTDQEALTRKARGGLAQMKGMR